MGNGTPRSTRAQRRAQFRRRRLTALALGVAARALREQPVQAVPLPLRDKGGQASKRMGHGRGYSYAHDFPEAISGQRYLDRPLAIYSPRTAGAEGEIAARLARWKKLRDGLASPPGRD